MGLRPICFTFNDFSDVSALTLNGSASTAISGGQSVLRLTPNLPSQRGSAFTTNTFPISNGFSTSFSFQMTNPSGTESDGPGADGMVFILQNNSNIALGGNGGQLGYGGIYRSVGIEFDTWNNGINANFGDPNGNHVGIDLNGSLVSAVVNPVLPARLNNGNVWFAWVDYMAKTKRLEVRVSTTNVRPAAPALALTVDLVQILGSANAFVGFSAATGTAFENHDVLAWKFCTKV